MKMSNKNVNRSRPVGHPCSHKIKIFFFLNSYFTLSVVHKTLSLVQRWFVLNRLNQNETKTREITFSLLTNVPMSGVAVELLGFFLEGMLRQAYFASITLFWPLALDCWMLRGLLCTKRRAIRVVSSSKNLEHYNIDISMYSMPNCNER